MTREFADFPVTDFGQAGCVLHACALSLDLGIPVSHSLKAKRVLVKRFVDPTCRSLGA